MSAGEIGTDRLKKKNTFTVNSSGTVNGYQIYAMGIPQGVSFYKTAAEVVENHAVMEETALAPECPSGWEMSVVAYSPYMAPPGARLLLLPENLKGSPARLVFIVLNLKGS